MTWTQPGPGRTKLYDRRVTTSIDRETAIALTFISRRRKVSTSDLLRQYIEWGLEADETRDSP